MSHNHHHSTHHHRHSNNLTYHLQGDKLNVHFSDNYTPDVTGEIHISHFHHGHGGQNVNKSNKGVHITFRPDNSEETILASCNNERSEIQNKNEALKSLLDRIEEKFKKSPPRKQTKTPYSSKLNRIQEKKRRGYIKSNRKSTDSEF